MLHTHRASASVSKVTAIRVDIFPLDVSGFGYIHHNVVSLGACNVISLVTGVDVAMCVNQR